MQRSCKALLLRRRAASDTYRSGSKRFVLISWGLIFLMSTFISPGNCFEDGMCRNINEVGSSQVSTSENCLAQEYAESEVHKEQSMDSSRTSETCGVNDELLIREEDMITEKEIEVVSPSGDKQVVFNVASDSQIKEEKDTPNGNSIVKEQEHVLDEEHLDVETNPENNSLSVKEQVVENTTDSEVKEEAVPTLMENLDSEVKEKNRATTSDNKLSELLEDAYHAEVKPEKEAPKHDITTEKELVSVEHSSSGTKVEKMGAPKSDKLSRVTPPSLGEFKSRTLSLNERYGTGQSGSSSVVKNRVEPSGKEYNYASASKGAKVLAFNKEANGASNILAKDKDKYLRNPCSSEGKYVVIELSEETLVDTIEIGNFEHYSSNLKEFELLGSLIYPTDSWIKIANFTAANVKQKQRFVIQEPKWARYLKLNLPTHYGSEFYCTLSVLEVYGVDAVETMLEDLISVQDNQFGLENPPPQTSVSTPPIDQQQPSVSDTTEDDDDDLYSKIFSEMYYGPKKQTTTTQQNDGSKRNGMDTTFAEKRPPQIGRMPGDTVLKILMQKVRSLDVNSAVLERYLEDLNNRYAKIFRDVDSEIDDKELAMNQIRTDITNIRINQEAIRRDIGDLLPWKSMVSSQLDRLVNDNADLRLEVEKVCDNHVDMENRSLVVIVISFGFGIFALFKLVVDLFASACKIQTSEAVCMKSCGWILLLLSSSLVTFVIVL